MEKPVYLYHGSQYVLDEIIPKQATGLEDENGTELGIYAFSDKFMTIPFALPIKPNENGNKHFEVNLDTGEIIIYSGKLDEDGVGYIYQLRSDSFYQLDDRQWLSKVPVTPIEVTPIFVKDYLHLVHFKNNRGES